MFQVNRDDVDKAGANLQQPINRRAVLGGSVAAGLGIFGGAMIRGGTLAAPSETGPAAREAFQDAAATPAARQVLVLADDASVAKAIDLFVERLRASRGGGIGPVQRAAGAVEQGFRVAARVGGVVGKLGRWQDLDFQDP